MTTIPQIWINPSWQNPERRALSQGAQHMVIKQSGIERVRKFKE